MFAFRDQDGDGVVDPMFEELVGYFKDYSTDHEEVANLLSEVVFNTVKDDENPYFKPKFDEYQEAIAGVIAQKIQEVIDKH